MPTYERGASVRGVPVEVKFQKSTMIFLVHPEGAVLEDSTTLRLKVEQMNNATKHWQRINRKLTAGTLDADEYEEKKQKLDEAREKDLADLTDPERIALVEKQYVSFCRDLLNQRDGEAVGFEEAERLTKELEGWSRLSAVRPVAVPYLRACVLGWDYYEDEKAEAPLPVTTDNINRLTDDQLALSVSAIFEHYQKEEKEEKKSSENLPNDSAMKTDEQEQSPTGSPSTQLPNSTDKTPTMLLNGESESFAAPC